jgi:hypothetical protein
METISLKSLAVKILTENSEGNSQETKSFPGGKPKGNQGASKETKARGYGCGDCGNKIYQAVNAWEMSELPAVSPWTYEYRMVTPWKCEHCDSVYEIIGRSKGLQPII